MREILANEVETEEVRTGGKMEESENAKWRKHACARGMGSRIIACEGMKKEIAS